LEHFAAELEKQTNGAYKIDFYPASSLFKEAETLNSLIAGVADIACAQISAQEQVFPLNSVFTLPGLAFPDTTAGHKAAKKAAADLHAKYKILPDEIKDWKRLGWHVLPANMVISKRTKVTVPNDLKGLKVAALGKEQAMVKQAGGAAVNIIPPQVYDNMDKAVIDAALVSWIHMPSQHLYEVAQYFLDISLGNNIQLLLMNWKTWNSLPPDVQKIIEGIEPGTSDTVIASYMKQVDQGRKLVVDAKRTIVVPTADQNQLWDNLAPPLFDLWLSQMKTKGVNEAPEILKAYQQARAAAWKSN